MGRSTLETGVSGMSARLPALVRLAVTVILGGIGAAAGFSHTHDWAAAHGQTGWLAWADAIVIEGMAVVAGFEVHRDHQASRSARLPLTVLVVAFLVQMTAQVAQAEPTPAGWLLAAMPALGFLTVVKLAMRHTPDENTAHGDEQQPVPQPGPPGEQTPIAAAAPTGPSSGSVLSKLPGTVRTTILEQLEHARHDGRTLTPDELRATIGLPDATLDELAAELNAPTNGTPVPH